MSYQEQLETSEWRTLREQILQRDKNHCQLCGKGPAHMIKFNETVFYIGLDHFLNSIDCSNAIENEKPSLGEKHNPVILSKIPYSDYYCALTAKGFLLYSTWKSLDKFHEGNKPLVAKVICDDGYIAYVLYFNKEELPNLFLPRIYVSKRPVFLNVHHKRYILDHKAWEYDNDELVTLCQSCHSKVHEFIPVHVYYENEGRLMAMNYTPCHRCNGMGYFPEYNHVQNGVCFRCHGARFEELIKNEKITI